MSKEEFVNAMLEKVGDFDNYKAEQDEVEELFWDLIRRVKVDV